MRSKNNHETFEKNNTSQAREPRASGRLAALGLMVAGLAGAGIHEKIEDNHQAQEIRLETKDMLKKQGTHLTLASGERVTIKGLDFTDEQVAAAHMVYEPNADSSSVIKEETFTVDTEKTHKRSSGGLFMLPLGRGISLVPTPGTTTTEKAKYDDTVLQHINRDNLNTDNLNVYIASTEDIKGVSAKVYYDNDSEDLVLRAYYDTASPSDNVEYLAVIEGLENQ